MRHVGSQQVGLHFQFEFHITVLRYMGRVSVKQFVTNCNIKNMRFFLCTVYINNHDRTERPSSRFFPISSLCRELSPTRTLKWPGRNLVQITCSTSGAYHVLIKWPGRTHVQHVERLSRATCRVPRGTTTY